MLLSHRREAPGVRLQAYEVGDEGVFKSVEVVVPLELIRMET